MCRAPLLQGCCISGQIPAHAGSGGVEVLPQWEIALSLLLKGRLSEREVVEMAEQEGKGMA